MSFETQIKTAGANKRAAKIHLLTQLQIYRIRFTDCRRCRKAEKRRSRKAEKQATTTISQRTKTRVTRIILAVCQIYKNTTKVHREKIIKENHIKINENF